MTKILLLAWGLFTAGSVVLNLLLLWDWTFRDEVREDEDNGRDYHEARR